MMTCRTAALPVIALLGLAACADPESGEATGDSMVGPDVPYENVATIKDLMRGTITLNTEIYWESVMIVWDANGETIFQPETDEEWIEVWSAALTVAESGNLLMMPGRAIDDGEWMRWSAALRDAGKHAAEVAADRSYEGVLNVGEEIYNACVGCHRIYVPAMSDI